MSAVITVFVENTHPEHGEEEMNVAKQCWHSINSAAPEPAGWAWARGWERDITRALI